MPLIINGMKFDWSSGIVNVDGQEFEGIKEVDYSGALEPGLAYGNRPQPAGRTRGKYTAEAKMTMYRAEAEDLLDYLFQRAQAQGRGFMEIAFQLVISYSEPDAKPIVDLIEKCRIKKHGNKASEGGEALVTEFDLSTMLVKPNGRLPFGRIIE